MLAGHIGVAVGLKRSGKDLNLGLLVLAAMLPDLVLWCLVLAGREHVTIPGDYASLHYLTFSFPYSHSLLGTLVMSMVVSVGAMIGGTVNARRYALLLAAAVLSHFLLDVLVHVPELPLAGESSFKIGLGLWNWMPAALALESLITLIGLTLWLGQIASRSRRIAAATYVIALLALTIVGQTLAPAPDSPTLVATTSLAAIAVIVGIAYALDSSQNRSGSRPARTGQEMRRD